MGGAIHANFTLYSRFVSAHPLSIPSSKAKGSEGTIQPNKNTPGGEAGPVRDGAWKEFRGPERERAEGPHIWPLGLGFPTPGLILHGKSKVLEEA